MNPGKATKEASPRARGFKWIVAVGAGLADIAITELVPVGHFIQRLDDARFLTHAELRESGLTRMSLVANVIVNGVMVALPVLLLIGMAAVTRRVQGKTNWPASLALTLLSIPLLILFVLVGF